MARPRKICILADSHAAALKRGWSLIQDDFPGTELTFFAGTSGEWNSLRVIDGKLVPESAVLREQFARSAHHVTEIADDFDAYLICGIGLAISPALKFWLRQEKKEWPMLRTAVAWHISNINAAHVLAALREITAKPILLLAGPFQPRAFCLFSPSINSESAAAIRTIFFEECEALAAKHEATFFPQPKKTWAPNGVTTKMRFANPDLLDGKEDRRHCTPEYGAIILTDILENALAS